MNCVIKPMQPEDWPEVCEVYREGIATGNATFATELPGWEWWDSTHRKDCRLIARELIDTDNRVPVSESRLLGWAALSPVSARRVYSGVAEVSVYVAASARGRGIGKELLQALIVESELQGVWTLQAGIFPENAASIELHKRCGFREVGARQRIGKLGNVWRDVLLLERRSASIGI